MSTSKPNRPAATRIAMTRGLIAALVAFLAAASTGLADPEPLSEDRSPTRALEHEFKAVFLSKLISFVEWPADRFDSSDSDLVIGILGDDPFGPPLDQAVADKRVGSHRVVVRRLDSLADAGNCHVVYVSASEKAALCEILASLYGRPVLTVSDLKGFSRKGGIVTLIMSGGRVRLTVNPEAYKGAGLRISAKLLQFSTETAGDECGLRAP